MDHFKHPMCNGVFITPGTMTKDECSDLHVNKTIVELGEQRREFRAVQSFWKPDEEELRSLAAGGAVVLTILGSGMPPVMMAVTPIEANDQPADKAYLLGHKSFAEMMQGHIHVWRNALEAQREATISDGGDSTFCSHELAALGAIEVACLEELKKDEHPAVTESKRIDAYAAEHGVTRGIDFPY